MHFQKHVRRCHRLHHRHASYLTGNHIKFVDIILLRYLLPCMSNDSINITTTPSFITVHVSSFERCPHHKVTKWCQERQMLSNHMPTPALIRCDVPRESGFVKYHAGTLAPKRARTPRRAVRRAPAQPISFHVHY